MPERLLYNLLQEEYDVHSRNFQLFLLGTIQNVNGPASGGFAARYSTRSSRGGATQRYTSPSPVSLLRGFEEPLKLIQNFCRSSIIANRTWRPSQRINPPQWNDTILWTRMTFCCGEPEYPDAYSNDQVGFVEALDGYGCGDPGVKYINDHALQELYNEREAEEEHGVLDKNGDFHHGKCSLFTPTTVCFDGLKRVVEDNCEKKNKDGSYLSEVQIRHEFYDYMMKKCNKDGEDFQSLYYNCSCGVLPGDTVYFTTRYDGPGGNYLTHFEPASEEELLERGYLTGDSTATLTSYEYWAMLFRNEKNEDAQGQALMKGIREAFETDLKERYDGMQMRY